MRITLINLFRKPVTVHYPTSRAAVSRTAIRGLLALTYDKETGEENCIGCRLCEYICPPAVIKVEMLKAEKRNFAKTFTLELYACEFCELCVQVCPTDAIIMMKSFDLRDRRSPRDAARQGSAARDRPAARAVVGDRQPAARHADAAEEAPAAAHEAGPPPSGADPAVRGRRKRPMTPNRSRFWALAVVLVGSALAVVLSKNLFHSVLWLALALTGTAGIFLTARRRVPRRRAAAALRRRHRHRSSSSRSSSPSGWSASG